jgi:glutathione S-transferase
LESKLTTPCLSLNRELTETLQTQWVANLKNASEDYKNSYTSQYYNILSRYYSQHGGPFLLGDRVSYADFAVYQSLDNDEKTGTLPVCDHCTLDGTVASLTQSAGNPTQCNCIIPGGF